MALPRSWLASFPDDVVEEILTRLPPKPLVRFRCVSRCWKSNIADPEFIEKHLTVNKAKSLSDYYNNDNNNVGYLLWREIRRQEEPPFAFESDFRTVVCNTDGSLTEISYVQHFFGVGGFCNGIFYSVAHQAIPCNAPSPDYYPVYNPEVALWNPSIRKEKELPPVLNDDRFETCAYQLAFPTSQNDLKFLVFGRFIKRGVPSRELEAQVYTLSTNSWSWVELQVYSLDIGSVGPITRIAPSPHLFYNGALHFIATTSRDYTFILCFDVDNEQFREIKLPDNYSNGLSLMFKQLVVFKGSLALIAFFQDEAESIEVCRIWVISECGLADSSWTLRFSVPLSGVEDFLGCTGSGELVIRKLGNQVFLFDPENQNEKDLGIQNLTPVERLDPLVYTANLIESLVLLNEETIF